MKGTMKWLLASAIALTALPSSAANPEFRLKFAHHNPPGAFLNVYGTDVWAKNIETRTNGRVKIDLYPAQMLGRANDTYDNTINGVSDIGWTYIAYMPGRFPLTEVVMLPMLGLDTASIASKVIWDVYENTPYLKKEFSEVKLLTLNTHDGNPICTTKQPVHTAADLAGKKLRTAGGPLNPFMQALGATPMSMPSVDTYQAAEKGVIDGAVLVYEAVQMQNLQEVMKHYLEASVSSGAFALFMNKKVWDKLPPDIQKIFDEESGDKASQIIAKACDDNKHLLVADITKAGGKIYPMDPAEAAKWREKARPVWDKWAADLEAKGIPGKAVLEHVLKKVDELKKQGF